MFIALPLIALASASAVAHDAGALPVAGDATSAARFVAAFGTVTSTYRSVEHNRLVGGVPNSYHLSGRAIDIVRRPGVSHSQIVEALRSAGYSLVESLDEGDHSHFAFGPAAASPVEALLATITTQPVAEQPARPESPLLADRHGTLILDVPDGGSATGVRAGK